MEISKYSKMISKKQKEKENRKQLLKISMMKLHLIEDPETRLRRSVLINNAFRSLQLEHRESVRQEQLERLRRKRSNDCLTITPVQPKVQHLSEGGGRSENVTAEDILSDVILPPPLNPSLNHVVVENYKVIDCFTGNSSSLPPPWEGKEYLDWAQISQEEQKIWQDEGEDGDDINIELDSVDNDAMNEDEGYDGLSDSSSDDGDSNDSDTDIVEEDANLVICKLDTTVKAVKSAPPPQTTSLIPSLMPPLES